VRSMENDINNGLEKTATDPYAACGKPKEVESLEQRNERETGDSASHTYY